jgi:hypothetical protein
MTNEPELVDVKSIWQNQSVDGPTMSLEEVRKKIGQLQKKIRQRSVIMGLALPFGLALCARTIFKTGDLIVGTGATLIFIGVAYVGYQLLLLRKKPAVITRENEPLASAVFYRTQLERQRNFHGGRLFWSRLAIVVPGAVVLLIGRAIEHPERIHQIRMNVAAFVVLGVLAVANHLRLARKYQREIDALGSI